jgi:uncharacterized repeat protein (TIGR02543 family)
VSVDKIGEGRVTSTPVGIDCGERCWEKFPEGKNVTLMAEAANGWTFDGWGGACSGTSVACTVSMNEDLSVSATFERNDDPEPPLPPGTHRLSVTLQGVGSGSVTSQLVGIDCPDECSAEFADGTAVTLTATPAEDSHFTGWGGACEGTNATCTATINQDTSVTASFQQEAAEPPNITSFTADPSTIRLGETTTLAWSVTGNGTLRLTLEPGVGNVTGQPSTTVSPTQTTTYTLTATSRHGSDTTTVTVTVEEATTDCSDPNQVVIFVDENLEVAVREALGKSDGPITCADMQELFELNVPGRNIQELKGLQHATNLLELWLQGNQVRDVTLLNGRDFYSTAGTSRCCRWPATA